MSVDFEIALEFQTTVHDGNNMDSSSSQKVAGPKQVKQTFNILLHQALDEEQQPPSFPHQTVEVSPVSCPTKPFNRAEAWDSAFSASLQPPQTAPGEPVRVKFTRKRGKEARAMTQKPVFDPLEVQKRLLWPKLKAWKSLSDTETDDVEDELTHRRAKGTKKGKKKGDRPRILGAVNLTVRPK